MKADAGKRIRILVVEDHIDLDHELCTDLQNAGFETLHAAHGAEALTLAKDAEPALIILDLRLQEMPDREVLKQLKMDPFTDRIAVVILSAKAEETDRILALELGADDYVTKPFSPRELILRVKSILRATLQEAGVSESIKIGELRSTALSSKSGLRANPWILLRPN